MGMSSSGFPAQPAGSAKPPMGADSAALRTFIAFRTLLPWNSQSPHPGSFAEPIKSRQIQERGFSRVANTKKIADKLERKKVKRAARKKAAPKAKRTTPRGSMKKKVKKLARGQSKR
jgi:hypothetical protein